MPAIPKTRFGLKPVASFATYVITSRGFETTMTIEFGLVAFTCSDTLRTIPAFVDSRSSRLIPGFRGIPAVMTTMSLPAVAS